MKIHLAETVLLERRLPTSQTLESTGSDEARPLVVDTIGAVGWKAGTVALSCWLETNRGVFPLLRDLLLLLLLLLLLGRTLLTLQPSTRA